jgi:co-chaperonin GroES (HSP10)
VWGGATTRTQQSTSTAARVLTVKRNRMKEDVTAAMMYCRENKHILHKHYTEIAKEMMHEGDHHFIAKHKALLPTFEDEDDDNSESKIDVGAD